MKHTPGPWEIGEFDEHLGYDCMTAGISVGPLTLDGGDYGQEWCEQLEDSAKDRMFADAKLIAAAPDMLAALEAFIKYDQSDAANGVEMMILYADALRLANAAIGKATGEPE